MALSFEISLITVAISLLASGGTALSLAFSEVSGPGLVP